MEATPISCTFRTAQRVRRRRVPGHQDGGRAGPYGRNIEGGQPVASGAAPAPLEVAGQEPVAVPFAEINAGALGVAAPHVPVPEALHLAHRDRSQILGKD